MKEVVCFFLKGREFGVDVSQMKTIAHRVELQPREGLPDFVKGIVDIHGEQIPLVDVDQLLQIPDGNGKTEKRNVIFNASCGSFAIESDGISEIVSVEDNTVQGVPGFFHENKTDYADCVIQKKNHALVVVINPDRLLTAEQNAALKKIIDEIEQERLEAERKRREEERRRKEEEKRKREEEMARMQEEAGSDAKEDNHE
ncbi:MAG: chemotaxis protein CheW [Eubacterium sp.]|nr:chemotaxis protein CheW [Eubacterium sp.]